MTWFFWGTEGAPLVCTDCGARGDGKRAKVRRHDLPTPDGHPGIILCPGCEAASQGRATRHVGDLVDAFRQLIAHLEAT